MSEIEYTTREELKATIETLVDNQRSKGGFKRVYCVACGGSLSCFYPMVYFLKSEAKTITCEMVSSNEFVHATPKALGPDCLVIAMSLAGGTPETVMAAKLAHDAGAVVVTLSSMEDVPIRQYGDEHILYRIDTDFVIENSNQYVILYAAIELLRCIEGYKDYQEALDGIAKIPGLCDGARRKLTDRAVRWGEAVNDEPIIYTMASGPSTFVAYMESICMIMEMEWMHSSAIHSGEYFHGPFEITESDVCFLMLESTGRTRPLDERALRFLHKYSSKVEVIDCEELGILGIDEKVAEYFSPILLWVAAIQYTEGLGLAKNHPLLQRRYMYKVEY